MTHPKPPSLTRELTLAILPLFFGGFLFTALVETYKDDMSSRKDLVLDFYRPMREAQTDCRAIEQQLLVADMTFRVKRSDWFSSFSIGIGIS